jgi:type VI secretion system protein ImpG
VHQPEPAAQAQARRHLHGLRRDPEFLSFRNITPATSSFAPPLNRDFLWKLISNMSLNYLSLADVNALKVILETYDLPRYYDQHAEKVSKRLLGGLKSIKHHHVDRLHRGCRCVACAPN